ncbi:hypothetical protein R6Q59_004887 [Mikania micrantha]
MSFSSCFDGVAYCAHYAVRLCEYFIVEDDDIGAVDRAGQTTIRNVVMCYNKEVALPLIRRGAYVVVKDKKRYTLLVRASDEFRPILIDRVKAMLEGWTLLQQNLYREGKHMTS